MSYCPAHGFFIGTSCTLCWINGPLRICPKHDWNMGTYCAACRDEALEAYRKVCIGGYKICNKHGPYSEPSCQKCQSELNENMSRIAESIAQREDTMKAPTEEQLRDPAWWDDNAPEGATHAIFGDFTRWLMLDHGIWRFWEGGWWSRPSVKPAGEILARPTKPAAPEWDGEGLPPVGCECEIWYAGYWVKAKVVHSTSSGILVSEMLGKFPGKVHISADPKQFRTIRTKEQREAYELANCINSQVCMGWEKTLQVAEYVVAAGWRKAGDE